MKGFTIVEFIAVLAIGAIFLIAAVPGYQALIQNNKVVSITNKLSASLNMARMEAVKRGVRVSVCPAANNAFTACGSNTQWNQGWIVFTDSDNNNAIDSANDLVKIAEAVPNGTTISSTSSIISYDGSGFVSSGASTLNLRATGCTGNNARTVNVSSSGRLSVVTGSCN
ncbi:GspH/FimT family pseudopilin [Legionella londiniensis]|uniref:Type II secretion system protein H n=1 Tax=Legionella londiniensis TaxID=45068 RepID=A0A0W0VQ86_9GAMM|nr:GspH/FimT family pseudopilin [Legionella londiniensis]KTD22340.1 type IV pre-pilin [Legionella londiniensis]STX93086.1 type IV pre-pilin [Legionella londiniensis]